MTQLAFLHYWGVQITDLTGTKGNCSQPREIGPDSGKVGAFLNGRINICGGANTQGCYAYDMENDRWVSAHFRLHGAYGMCSDPAGVVMNERSWLVTGGQTTYPHM